MEPITNEELADINGGVFPWVIFVVALINCVIDDWDNFKRGLYGLPCNNKSNENT